MDQPHHSPDRGPGCGHDLCLFQRFCLIDQAEVELLAAIADRAFRRHQGQTLARVIGLGASEGRLLEVVLYSPSLSTRERAADLLMVALRRVTRRVA